ncbi:MAG TPA: DUF2339 domain-containing protein [Chitinophagaceae bacterium]|jgi:uncharacterized membrane protein|nr:DUF2339 domain-containing protein [Chitinophagaceae bacterium]
MNEGEQLNALRTELQALAGELAQQQARIEALQRQIEGLGGPLASPAPPLPPAPPAERPVRSLEQYIGLRLIHLAGIVVLVIGLSIGVKYAIDRNLISEGARIGLAYGAGALLFALAWRLQRPYPSFSAILFSGAMASLYFTSYAAFAYYALFPPLAAFAIMVLLTLFTVFRALYYNRQEIALLGQVGAYAIPFLISTNADNPLVFFLYITIINAGVVYLSLRKEWLLVTRTAQLVTWLLFAGWCVARYTPEDTGIALFFMVLFFLLFSFAVLGPFRKARRPLSINRAYLLLLNNISVYVSSLLLFAGTFAGVDVAAVSVSCAGFAALQTALLYYSLPEERFAHQLHGSFTLFLLVIFIAAEWGGITVTLLWLTMAVILFAWGALARSRALRLSSIVLIGITLVKLLVVDSLRFTTIQKIIAYITLGVLMLVVSFFYQRNRMREQDEASE